MINKWLSIILSPIIFLVVYDVIFNYIPMYQGHGTLPIEFVFFMAFLDLTLLGTLLWFYQASKKYFNNGAVFFLSANRYGVRLSRQGYIILVASAFVLFFYLIYNVFGNFDISNIYKYNQRFYSQSKVGTSWVFFFLYAFVFVALFDIYLHGFTRFKIYCVLILILINAATGGRGNVITYLLLFVIIYGVTWRGKNVVYMTMLVVFLMSFTFLYNTLSRSGAENLSGYLESKSSVADLNQVHAIEDSFIYWQDNGACYTCFVEDLKYFFIPRLLFPGKPISNAETRTVYPDVAAIGSTYTFGIYGSSLLNLGVLSFLFIPAFYFIYSYMYFHSLYSRHKSFLNYFFIYCGVNAVQFVRGGVFDVRLIRLFVTFALAYFLYRSILIFFGVRVFPVYKKHA